MLIADRIYPTSYQYHPSEQRNVSFTPSIIGIPFIYPFMSGNEDNPELFIELVIDYREVVEQRRSSYRIELCNCYHNVEDGQKDKQEREVISWPFLSLAQ